MFVTYKVLQALAYVFCVFHRGGRVLTITGTDLGYVQKPQMFAYVPVEGGYYPTDSTVSSLQHINLQFSE